MKVVDIEQVLVSSAHEQSMARDVTADKWSAVQDQHENPQHTVGEQSHLRTVETSGLPTRDTGTKDELPANHMMAKQLENKSVGTSKEHEMELNEKCVKLEIERRRSREILRRLNHQVLSTRRQNNGTLRGRNCNTVLDNSINRKQRKLTKLDIAATLV